jgi:hypothetical protein
MDVNAAKMIGAGIAVLALLGVGIGLIFLGCIGRDGRVLWQILRGKKRLVANHPRRKHHRVPSIHTKVSERTVYG